MRFIALYLSYKKYLLEAQRSPELVYCMRFIVNNRNKYFATVVLLGCTTKFHKLFRCELIIEEQRL